MSVIQIKKRDSVYCQVICDRGVAQEITDQFTFQVPGYQHMPAYKSKFWDGKIRIFSPKDNLLYVGLLEELEKFAYARDYEVEYLDDFSKKEFSLNEAQAFADSLKIPPPIVPRDYQVETLAACVRNGRQLMISPTASGKSLMIYMIYRWYDTDTLIVVPNISLVNQMIGDFKKYGYDVERHAHGIMGGVEKDTGKQLVVSTWQSIYKQPKSWFDRFNVIIGDEAHLFKSKSLTDIMQKTPTAEYKFGFTGTLDGTQTNEMVLSGLFGPVKQLVTTSELIGKKHLSDFKIKCLVLKYPDEVKKLHSKDDYQAEIDFLVNNESRNRFITNLCTSLKGNTLLLFNYVEKHGKPLYRAIKETSKYPVYYVSGEVEGAEREAIRKIVNEQENSIIVASLGTFSTGIDISNLHNIIFSAPSKSRVRVLQSIGRGLRLSKTKTHCTLFDIADDLSWKTRRNFTLEHFRHRVEMYNKERFEYKVYNVGIS